MAEKRGNARAIDDSKARKFEPPTGKAEACMYDAGSDLVLRVNRTRKTGLKKFWLHRTVIDSRKRLIPLGTFPEMDTTTAREKSRTWAPGNKLPELPPTHASLFVSGGVMTLGDAVDAYLASDLRSPSTQQTARTIAENYLVSWRDLPVEKVSPTIAAQIIENARLCEARWQTEKRPDRSVRKIKFLGYFRKTKPTPGNAEKLNAILCAAFNAIPSIDGDDGTWKQPKNPFAIIKKRDEYKGHIIKRRKKLPRALERDEIPIVWEALNSCLGTPPTARSLMFMLVTGQRPGEVLGMRYGEIKDNWWCIPIERVKTNKANNPEAWRPHYVYLTPLALSIIGQGNSSDLVFQGAVEVKSPRSLRQLLNRERDQAQSGAKARWAGASAPWSANDLRRTLQTRCRMDIKLDREDINIALNHGQRGDKIDKSYDGSNPLANYFQDEKKLVMESWAHWLVDLIGKAKTATIRFVDPKKYDPDTLIAEAAEKTNLELAGIYGVSETTIRMWCRKHGIATKRSVRKHSSNDKLKAGNI